MVVASELASPNLLPFSITDSAALLFICSGFRSQAPPDRQVMLTKPPARLFYDAAPGGGLCRILHAVLRLRARRSWPFSMLQERMLRAAQENDQVSNLGTSPAGRPGPHWQRPARPRSLSQRASSHALSLLSSLHPLPPPCRTVASSLPAPPLAPARATPPPAGPPRSITTGDSDPTVK